MSESEAYLQLSLILGIIFCIPLFWKLGVFLGSVIADNLFPPRTITIKVKNADGKIEYVKVDLKDEQALIDSLYKASANK